MHSFAGRTWDGMLENADEEEKQEAIKQIINILNQSKPKLTREFVKQWVNRIHFYYFADEMIDRAVGDFVEALKEAGVEVSDEEEK
jgi:hypothetical protein